MNLETLSFKMIGNRCVVGSVLLAGVSPLSVQAQDKPNVIFILVDDMGWSDVGFNGSRYYETPNLDGFAQQATKFTNAYSACAVSSPSRASIMTGQYPSRVGITDWLRADVYDENPDGVVIAPDDSITTPMMHKYLDNRTFNLAKAFKTQGYTTCHIGKWHLGGGDYKPEQLQGFDFNYGGGHTGHPQSFFYPWDNPSKSHVVEGLPAHNGDYLTDVITDRAVEFIEEHKDAPFFLNLWHYGVHAPIQAKQSDIDIFKGKPTDSYQKNPTYAAMVKSIDDSFGAIVNTLQANGLMENTIVIFTSDNGHERSYSLSPVLRGSKGDPYEGGIREPLLVYWPGVTEPGSVSEAVVSGPDYLPTLCGAIGADIPQDHPIDGIDFRPFVADADQKSDRTVLWHYPHYWGGVVTPYSVLRDGDWKLIVKYATEESELYHLAKDGGEKTNLALVYPDKVKELTDKLMEQLLLTNAKIPMSLRKLGRSPLVNQDAASFTGSWAKQTQSANFMQDVMSSFTKGDSYEFEFTGTGVELFGNVAPAFGSMDVYVDGVYQTVLHQRGASAANNLSLLKINHLSYGDHKLKIEVKTNGRPVNIDAFKVLQYDVYPENQSIVGSVNDDLLIRFSEPVSVVDGKKLYIKSGDRIVQSIELDRIAPSEFRVLSVPMLDLLDYDMSYHVEIEDQSFVNGGGVFYAGIDDAQSWSFRTPKQDLGSVSGNYGWSVLKGDYLDLGSSGPVVDGAYSIELWIKPDGKNGGWNGLIGNNPGNNNDRSPFINLYNNTELEYGFGAGTTNVSKFSPKNIITTHEWNHIALTFNGTHFHLYVDGEFIETTSVAAGLKPQSTPIRFINLVKQGAANFSGVIDEVRVWKGVRTQEQIQEGMLKPLQQPAQNVDLLGYWNFNKSVDDLSSSAFKGEAKGSASFVSVDYDAGVIDFEKRPRLLAKYPLDNTGEVSFSEGFGLKFISSMQASEGRYVRLFLADGSRVDSIASTQVGGLGTDSLYFDFSVEQKANSGYYILVDERAFINEESMPFAGITEPKEWNFYTGAADLYFPRIVQFTPQGEGVDVAGPFELTFSKPVKGAPNKYIRLYDELGTPVDSVMTIELGEELGSVVEFRFSSSLALDSKYYILLDDQAFFDHVGNPTQGLLYDWQWGFLTQSTPSSLLDGNASVVRLFPNPVEDVFYLAIADSDVKSAHLFDLEGRKVVRYQLHEGLNTLQSNGLKSGVYVLRIDGYESFSLKLIKK